MKQLSETWFIEPLFDYEYKSYEVMAYVQGIESHFAESKFYPYLDQVRKLLQGLEGFRLAKEGLEARLRSQLVEVDLQKLRLIREALPDSGGLISELDEIVKFAEKTLDQLQVEGQKQLDTLACNVAISPLGIIGPQGKPGLLLFRQWNAMRVYSYEFRMVRRPFALEAYKDVSTRYITEVTLGQFSNYSTIKWDMIKSQPALNVSASNAFLIETDALLPHYETLLPLAKQFLIKTLA